MRGARGGGGDVDGAAAGGTALPLRSFAAPEWRGEAVAALPAPPLATLLDPAGAQRTLHWGRNYLWLAEWPGAGPVVVKQFRHESLRARVRRRVAGSKARRSFDTARALAAAGVPTPEPLLWADAADSRGPAWYVCRHVEGIEARYPFRALAAGTLEEDFPQLPAAALLGAAASLARGLHAAGFWHRDLSAGNLLLRPDGSRAGEWVAHVVDLNRCRRLEAVSRARRLRDLARLPVHRRADQRALLAAYFGSAPPASAEWLYRLFHLSFHGRHRVKNRLRGERSAAGGARRGGLLPALRPRRAYPHLPPPPPAASARDRAVWDRLSDQPHQHASRAAKLAVRMGDLLPHARGLLVVAAAAPRIRRRYRRLAAALPGPVDGSPVAFAGAGVGLRPHREDPAALLAAVDALGVRHALLRLHAWEEEHDDEETLAGELRRRGIELVVALPQRRELVRDLARWRAAVARLGARFAPYAEAFQIGQGINRSKWGVWTLGEYQRLLATAAEALAPCGVPLVGPGVIDFEPHATAAAVNWPGLGVRLDALASLLYVDRRGAPEGTQLGFDALRKAALLRAIAETARWCAPRSWITEVNWPLREGPHAPAGRDVAVDEARAADYLARYYLPLLASGVAERIYWWQLVARGYGLCVAEADGLRRRPAFHALATMQRLLGRATCSGALPAPAGAHLYRFVSADGCELVAGWSATGEQEVTLPWRPAGCILQDGAEAPPAAGPPVRLGGSVTYFVRN
ncbi:MAG TPA: lipopolysaccharide kinase InaA family protein [Thermoanaerobaculia bacterium]|nr:lipopolysaccharide kinase InaA family protein [Thermoanaerobaculia bacterium]